MSKKQMVAPLTQTQGENLINHDQRRWDSGLIRDLPASEIPDDSVADLINAILFPTHTEGRTGSKEYSSTPLPTLRTGYTASKTGLVVRKTAGVDFSDDDLGNFFVWSDGENQQIVKILSINSIELSEKGDKAQQTGCAIREPGFGNIFHETEKSAVVQVGTRFFFADSAIAEYVEISRRGVTAPLASRSVMAILDEFVIVFNANGIFKLRFDTNEPYYFRINSEVPLDLLSGSFDFAAAVTALVDLSDITEERPIGRRYLYSASILRTTDLHQDRTTLGILIEIESGTVLSNSEFRDYLEVFDELPIGRGDEVYGVLTGDDLLGVFQTPQGWEVISDGQFQININGLGVTNISIDFTDVLSMTDVAERIENAMAAFFPGATCKFESNVSSNVGRFIVTSGLIDGGTVTVATAGLGGTDISGDLQLDAGSGNVDNAAAFTEPRAVGNLTTPCVNQESPATREFHWTHYSIYGTLDTGKNGIDPISGIGNNSAQYGWMFDVPAAKAFQMNFNGVNLITATVGEFHISDVGNTIDLENGNRFIINFLVDSSGNRVYTDTSKFAQFLLTAGDAAVPVFNAQAGVLGGGIIFRARQTGQDLLIDSGLSLTDTDVGKPIFWAGGKITHIKSVTSSTTAKMIEFETIAPHANEAATISPVSRIFNDYFTDDILRTRFTGFPLRNRFWTALPESELGNIVPGFIVSAANLGSKTFSSPIPAGFKYIGGYHNAAFHLDDTPEDAITMILRFPDQLIVRCHHSTYRSPTNVPSSVEIPEIGEFVAVLPSLTQVDDIGTNRVGSSQLIDIGREILMTSEPAIRIFDGYRYSEENLAELRIMDNLRELSQDMVSAYDHIGGYQLWGARRE